MALWAQMGWLARGVVIVLFIMSIWSLAVMIDRYLYFAAARKQSREFAPRVAGALREGKLDEAVKVADRNKKSHLAEVVTLRRRFQEIVMDVLRTGEEQGIFQLTDLAGTARAVLSLSIDLVRWFDPELQRNADRVARSNADLSLRMAGYVVPAGPEGTNGA